LSGIFSTARIALSRAAIIFTSSSIDHLHTNYTFPYVQGSSLKHSCSGPIDCIHALQALVGQKQGKAAEKRFEVPAAL
jgi:hypothetical protein